MLCDRRHVLCFLKKTGMTANSGTDATASTLCLSQMNVTFAVVFDNAVRVQPTGP